MRWRERAAESIVRDGGMESFDFLFALFASIFCMRDWIIASRPDVEQAVTAVFRDSQELALVRDLVNGSKHMRTTHLSVDGAATVAWEYAGHGKHRFVVPQPGGTNVDCILLADRCIHEIRTFMESTKLLMSG